METMHSVFKNIWLADDDQDDQLVFEKALKEVAPTVSLTLFQDCPSLLQELNQTLPDLLFLDINMPLINGKECLRLLKEIPLRSKLPVVIFSGSDYRMDILTSYGFGAALYAVKPPSYKEWVKTLKGILSLDWSDPEIITDNQYQNNRFVPFRAE